MAGLSIFYWVLIIAAAVLEVLIIVKFWKMCNDVRALRNHFCNEDVVEQIKTKSQSGQVSGVGLYIAIFVAIIILIVVFANAN